MIKVDCSLFDKVYNNYYSKETDMNESEDKNLYHLMHKNSIEHKLAQNNIESEAAKAMGMVIVGSDDLFIMAKYDILQTLYTSNLESISDTNAKEFKINLNSKIEETHERWYSKRFDHLPVPIMLASGVEDATPNIYEKAVKEVCQELGINIINNPPLINMEKNGEDKNLTYPEESFPQNSFYFIKLNPETAWFNESSTAVLQKLFDNRAGSAMIFENYNEASSEQINKLNSIVKDKNSERYNNVFVAIVETTLDNAINFSRRTKINSAIPFFIKLPPLPDAHNKPKIR